MVLPAVMGRSHFSRRTVQESCIVVIALLALSLCPSFLMASASPGKADRVIVIKHKRLLLLMKEGEIMKAYRVSLGKKPVGHKECVGDKRTPEGKYILDSRNPDSRFYKSIHISYPSLSDVRQARQRGVSPGGDIMIHGLPIDSGGVGRLHRKVDWTDGCIAVTNTEIEEIWRLVPNGTPIEISP